MLLLFRMKKGKIVKINEVKRKLFFAGAIGISIFLFFFVVSCLWIGYEVKNKCQEAKKEYRGDCVGALINHLNDEKKDFRSRNSAIWALGQLGDSRALPILEGYYTGNISAKEPLDKAISQYELKKAINLTSGGINITSIFWRYKIN